MPVKQTSISFFNIFLDGLDGIEKACNSRKTQDPYLSLFFSLAWLGLHLWAGFQGTALWCSYFSRLQDAVGLQLREMFPNSLTIQTTVQEAVICSDQTRETSSRIWDQCESRTKSNSVISPPVLQNYQSVREHHFECKCQWPWECFSCYLFK